MNFNKTMGLFLGMFAVSVGGSVQAQTEITVYNQNLALIKKQQKQTFKKGVNEIVIDEVAQRMYPESAYIYGDNLRILEQNYDFADVNYTNLLNENLGKPVKTVRINPVNGHNIYEKAELIAVSHGQPILKFDYGIETKFDGRVVFDKIPNSLNSTPLLKAKAESSDEGEKNVNLAYLTTGFSWNADYVAKIIDDKKIELLGRVSLKNNSGSDFENVRINLMAGEVYKVRDNIQPRYMVNGVRRADNMLMASAPNFKNVLPEPTALNGYYVYNLPQVTNLKDGQIKQVSFIDSKNVDYHKDNIINSELVFGMSKTFYKNVHPEITYTFKNEKDEGLGIPLPEGKISFYDYDKQGELQFVGENRLKNVAKGESIELALGKSFDVFSHAKITNIKHVNERKYKKNPSDRCVTAEQNYLYNVEYTVVNNGKYAENVILKQKLPQDGKIISESLESYEGDGNEKIWKMLVNPNETKVLEVSVHNKFELKKCD